MSIEDEISEIKLKIEEKDNKEIDEHIDWYGRTMQPFLPIPEGFAPMPDCTVKVAKVTDRAVMPKYAHEGDACFDLSVLIGKDFVPKSLWNGTDYIPEVDYISNNDKTDFIKTFYVDIPPHCEAVFTTGLKCEIPEGFSMKIHDRSSTGIKRGLALANSTGIIDAGYRGEIMIALVNQTNSTVRVYDGDRVAQGEIVENLYVSLTEVKEDDLSASERGANGIGSTGVK